MRHILRLTVITGLIAIVSACAQTPQVTSKPAEEFSDEGLYKVSSSGFSSAYARPGTNLSDYGAVHIATMQLDNIDVPNTVVGGTLRRDWQMDEERKGALQAVWDTAMQRSFNSYQQVASGESGLRINAEITRVAPGRPTATTIGGGVQPVGSSQDVIEVFVEFRLVDQPGGELLVVIRDSRTMLSIGMSRTGPVAMQAMFNSWAALLHTRISGR